MCRDYEENGDGGRPVGFGHMFETHYLAPLRAGKAFADSWLFKYYMQGQPPPTTATVPPNAAVPPAGAASGSMSGAAAPSI